MQQRCPGQRGVGLCAFLVQCGIQFCAALDRVKKLLTSLFIYSMYFGTCPGLLTKQTLSIYFFIFLEKQRI